MIRNMQIRSKLIAVLVIPLVALTVLAALGIGANVARGVQADRVNDQTAFAVSLSTLVHELQRERDLSAGWVGSGRDAGYGGVVAQRVAGEPGPRLLPRDVETSASRTEARSSGRGWTTAVAEWTSSTSTRAHREHAALRSSRPSTTNRDHRTCWPSTSRSHQD